MSELIYYTGIGSRSTPSHILTEIEKFATSFAEQGLILRSGHADGADMAFERGCDLAGGRKEIYLPWFKFNGSDSPLDRPSREAFDIAASIHPGWNTPIKMSAKRFHARNIHQVLGQDLKTPSKFVVCWTPNGEEVGGTRTAIVLAKREGIPVVNLANIESATFDLCLIMSQLRESGDLAGEGELDGE